MGLLNTPLLLDSKPPVSWTSGNVFFSGTNGLTFKSPAGQIRYTVVLPTAFHRCDISSKGAVLPGCNDAKMYPANSLYASAYSECDKIFDLLFRLDGKNMIFIDLK